ncbi:ATP-dependent RNA helicase DBP8, partial [Pseudovirgaria hyperparasitica]
MTSRTFVASPVASEENESDYDSDLETAQKGSRKRRRVSLNAEDTTDQEGMASAGPAKELHPSTTASRIQPKKHAAISKPSDGTLTETSIAHNTKGDFASLNVDPWLVSSLANMAIRRPTGIQRGCIPEILKGRDCIGGSRTGSGKTVAFAVPILQQWARDPIGIFAVVLTPTRELALQIFEQFKAISAPQSLKPILITGGSDMPKQALELAARPHVVIATPGRLADHITTSGEDTICGLRRVRIVVLDEADRLLASGPGSMLPDVETCLAVLPPSTARQTCLFTATVTPEVRALKNIPRPSSRPPLFICELDSDPSSSSSSALAIPDSLTQTYLKVPTTHREAHLHILLSTPANTPKPTIIFVNRTATATLLEHTLRLLAHRVTALHSALPQPTRTANLARFRARAARILVATDVAARGLDIPDVALVINYDVPRDPVDYIHRVGRTARAGREGLCVTFVGQRDVELVLAIEERVGREMEEFVEEGVSVEGRVVREGLKVVGEMKREAVLRIGEGRDVRGKRRRG